MATKTLALNTTQPKKRQRKTPWLTIILLLLPGTVIYVLFLVWPVLQSAYYSLYKWNGLGPIVDFIGIQNYVRALSHKVFQVSLWHTLQIVVLSLIVQLPLAIMLAIMVGRGLPGRSIFRTIFFLPYVFSEVITAILFNTIYSPQGGLFNALARVFVPTAEPIAVLANPQTALFAVFAVVTWKYFGLHMILYMAGLQQVPKDVEEAARVEGASEAQVLRHITLPLLAPTIRLTIYLSVLGSLNQFVLAWILTEGGPANSSELAATYVFKYGIQRMNLSYGSSVALILFAICLVFSLGYQRAVMRQDYTTR
jgi:raffinose/stachyose/melibiose transport system permease protein